jgi:hypothetical protein
MQNGRYVRLVAYLGTWARATGMLMRLGELARRHGQILALAAWAAVWFAILAPGGGIAWHYFVSGSRLLFDGSYGRYDRAAGGLHLYASYPWLQIGPLAFAAASVLRLIGPGHGVVAAQITLTGMGLAVLVLVRQIARIAAPERADDRGTRWTFLAGGAAFLIAWEELAVYYVHLDDGLALLLAAAALRAACTGRLIAAGLALGLAADAKPWALAFLPVLLIAAGRAVAPGTRRLVIAGAVAAAVTAAAFAAAWLPFLLADPGTLAAAHYQIANLPASGLRAMGITAASTPSWDRPAQVLLGCALGTLAVWRGRWPAVLLLGAGARIALDPAVHGYYTAGVLAGALVWDLAGARRPVPLWTIAAYGALDLVPLTIGSDQLRGEFRLYLVVAFTLAVLLGPRRAAAAPGPAAVASAAPGYSG